MNRAGKTRGPQSRARAPSQPPFLGQPTKAGMIMCDLPALGVSIFTAKDPIMPCTMNGSHTSRIWSAGGDGVVYQRTFYCTCGFTAAFRSFLLFQKCFEQLAPEPHRNFPVGSILCFPVGCA